MGAPSKGRKPGVLLTTVLWLTGRQVPEAEWPAELRTWWADWQARNADATGRLLRWAHLRSRRIREERAALRGELADLELAIEQLTTRTGAATRRRKRTS